MNKYVVIKDNSAGNDSVGEMWKETKIYDGTITLDEVMQWATGNDKHPSKKNIVLTRPEE